MADNPVQRLFTSHRGELESYLTRKIRDPEVAADLTQETFLRFMQRGGETGEVIGNVRSYLYRTAHNLMVDYLRQQGRARVDTPGPEVMDHLTDDRPDQEQATLDRERLQLLAAALRDLPLRSRQIFLLARIEGLSYREVAARLEISESSVQKHLARTLLHVTRRLAEGGEMPSPAAAGRTGRGRRQ
ncbi:RNA polymerase sigma factor [Poseidonocella sp. HB161398]|uniref:RNA polymerase sigma factor n=1 Tax=Poseidonocella sp. HB161398 TaxID=2320855 RepID=UPI001F100058|nr:RNA polymerase sigma factor [Poseidonocella sp. HB161398]